MGAAEIKTLNWHFILHGERFGRVSKWIQQIHNAHLSFCTQLSTENAGFGLPFLCACIYQVFSQNIVRLFQSKLERKICLIQATYTLYVLATGRNYSSICYSMLFFRIISTITIKSITQC